MLFSGQLERNEAPSTGSLAFEILDGFDALFLPFNDYILQAVTQHSRQRFFVGLRSFYYFCDQPVDAVGYRLALPLQHDGANAILIPFIVSLQILKGYQP